MQSRTPPTDSAKDCHNIAPAPAAPRALLAIALLVLLFAIFCPAFPRVNDVILTGLIAFSSLVALVMILFAKKPADIVSFPLFSAVILFVQLWVQTNITKAVLLQQPASAIINLISSPLTPRYAAICWCVIAAIVAALCAKLAIRSAATSQKKLADRHTNHLEKFYRAGTLLSRLLAVNTILWAAITIAGTAAAIALNVIAPSETAEYALTVAASALTFFPLILSLFTFAILLRKDFSPAINVQPIHVESTIVNVNTESQNPIILSEPEPEIEPDIAFDLANSHLSAVSEQIESVFSQPTHPNPLPRLFALDDCYEPIADRILSFPKAVVILAGQSKEHLPVTVPVNVALEIALSKKRCLIIDNDFTRNPLAAVFDLNPVTNAGKAIQTEYNFWVSPADHIVALAKKIKNAARAFDYVLVYSPSPFIPDLSLLNSDPPVASAKLAITLGPTEPLTSMLESLRHHRFDLIQDSDLIKKAI